MQSVLKKALQAGQLREIDLHAALFLHKLAKKSSPDLLLAAALTSRSTGDGHICLPLDKIAGQQVFTPDISCRAPDIDVWRENLFASGVVTSPENVGPLIIDECNRLYLGRYSKCESSIARDLLSRSSGTVPIDVETAAGLIKRLFPGSTGEDWQKIAVAVAALKKFVVISGGPGTGKTYTVARILALLQTLTDRELRVGLVAPTGKAAVRLQESIISAGHTLDDDLAAAIPAETKTIHRLLGYHPATGTFRYNQQNKLQLDLLVIDESSMIDVPLMASLVEALPDASRVIMLGDREQLTSVEAGSLLGDICSTRVDGWSSELCTTIRKLTGWAPEPVDSRETFADSIVLLQTSYRFREKQGIAELARAVNTGDPKQLGDICNQAYEDLVLDSAEHGDQYDLNAYLFAGFKNCFTSLGPLEALAAYAGFRVLCATREGPNGVVEINQRAENVLQRNGLLVGSETWYKGKPLIIRSNDYGLQLFNGDIGVVWPDSDGKMWAWFQRPDSTVQQVPLSRLPEHDTSYAITIHQSQGSEFSKVLLLLPAVENRVLCRELLYTGITRARDRLVVYGNLEMLAKGMERRVVRYSGLAGLLWKNEGEGC